MRIMRYETAEGLRIYRLTLRAFPTMPAHAYLVIDGTYTALIDTGSGSEQSDADLLNAMEALRTVWGEAIGWQDLSRIIITHGHIDHYGGIELVRRHTDAPIAMHGLDRLALDDHRAYVAGQQRGLVDFLRWAGADEAMIEQLAARYYGRTRPLPGCTVTDELQDGAQLDGRFTILHTPGHCAGQVCLRLGDLLFSADHILAHTNPRLVPDHLEPHNGLHAYLAALDYVAAQPGLRMALAGHEASIAKIYARIEAIRAAHLSRLEQTLAACAGSCSIMALTRRIYPGMEQGMPLVLAAQATATRIEYLQEQGLLGLIEAEQGGPARFYRVTAVESR